MLASAGFAADVIMTFDLTLHFETWTRRMDTPRQNAAMIKTLFNGAPDDIKRAFRVPGSHVTNNDFEFVIPGAVIRGDGRPAPKFARSLARRHQILGVSPNIFASVRHHESRSRRSTVWSRK